MKELKPNNTLFKTIKYLIEETKAKVTVTVNSSLTLMYWHIGKKIDEEILGSERAEYGKVELATEIKKILQQTPKTWDRAKKKALERKNYIEGLLNQ